MNLNKKVMIFVLCSIAFTMVASTNIIYFAFLSVIRSGESQLRKEQILRSIAYMAQPIASEIVMALRPIIIEDRVSKFVGSFGGISGRNDAHSSKEFLDTVSHRVNDMIEVSLDSVIIDLLKKMERRKSIFLDSNDHVISVLKRSSDHGIVDIFIVSTAIVLRKYYEHFFYHGSSWYRKRGFLNNEKRMNKMMFSKGESVPEYGRILAAILSRDRHKVWRRLIYHQVDPPFSIG